MKKWVIKSPIVCLKMKFLFFHHIINFHHIVEYSMPVLYMSWNNDFIDILLIKSLHIWNLNTTSNLLLHQFLHMPKIDAVSRFHCIYSLQMYRQIIPQTADLNLQIGVLFVNILDRHCHLGEWYSARLVCLLLVWRNLPCFTKSNGTLCG